MSARTFRRDRTRAIGREERRGAQRAKRVAMAAGGLFAAAAVVAPAANAADFEVNSLTDSGNGTCSDGICTLRDAVNEANGNGLADTITFAASVRGTIQLAGPFGEAALKITNESLDIVGPGADQLTISAGNSSRIFKIFGFDTADEEVTISGLTLTGGEPLSDGGCSFDTGDGGAILSTDTVDCEFQEQAAALTVSKVTIVDNEAYNGGGIAVERYQPPRGDAKAAVATGPASLTVKQSTISDNDAFEDGGGIAMYPGSSNLAVSNSTIVDNNANDGYGGGIEIFSQFFVPESPDKSKIEVDRTLAVENSTITGNDASENGGGIETDSAVAVSSTIVSGNTVTPPEVTKATAPSDLSTVDTTITAGYSLIGTTDGANVVTSPAGSNLIGVNPQLGPLQDNGGTTDTRLPATTSPAIDAGTANAYTAEQRETPRTIDRPPANATDGTDIGAVEVAADPPPPEEPVIVPDPEPTPLPGPATELCLGKQVILTKGGDANETLTGTGVDDGILGGGGLDTVSGLSGDDCLFGQVGNDLVVGGPGNDNANGDRDNDTVQGDEGSDSVRGQNGNDKVFGGDGDDPKVTGGAGDDKVSGGAGDDLLKGDGGNDVLDLGSGEDFVHSGGGADKIDAADGDKDRVICGTGKDVAKVDPVDTVDEDCNTVTTVG